MNFEPDIEWFPDAGPPRRSLAKMGGITEISRWRKPPVRNPERGQPRQGRRNDVGRFPQPLPGLTFVVWQGTGGLHHRLLWVLSRRARVFLFYWLIMYLFPRASAAESGGVWGSAPRRLAKLVCGVLKNVSSSGCRHSWFFLQRSLLSAEGAKYLLASIPSRNVTIRVRKRNEQLNLIIGVFSPQPVARACAVPKLFLLKLNLNFLLLLSYAFTLSRSPSSCAVLRSIAIRHKSTARRRATATIAFFRAAALRLLSAKTGPHRRKATYSG